MPCPYQYKGKGHGEGEGEGVRGRENDRVIERRGRRGGKTGGKEAWTSHGNVRRICIVSKMSEKNPCGVLQELQAGMGARRAEGRVE